MKTGMMRSVPDFIPELSEKFSLTARNPLKINGQEGAGRGNRTPMELLPTDFEFLEIVVCL